MNIAVIGIGLMGKPMCERLLSHKHTLTLWNRTRNKLDAFSGRATLANSLEEAIRNAEIVLTMLENGPVVNQLLFESKAFQAAGKGTLWIDMSSITPDMARAHHRILQSHGIDYLDAPVSGGTVGAEQGSLSIRLRAAGKAR